MKIVLFYDASNTAEQCDMNQDKTISETQGSDRYQSHICQRWM